MINLWTTWLLLIGLAVAFIALMASVWWLWRRRRRGVSRAELSEELAAAVERLQLSSVWQTGLFEADVHGFKGEVQGFVVDGELWERGGDAVFRLTLRFPRPLRQGVKVQTRRRNWLEALWPEETLEVGDADFDEKFYLYGEPDSEERIKEFFDFSLRHRLLDLVRRVEKLEMGDRSLHLMSREGKSVQDVERLVRDALRTALELYNRAVETGPARTATHTQYELVAIDALGRTTGGFPQGTDPEEGSLEALRASEPTEKLPSGSDVDSVGSSGSSDSSGSSGESS